MRLLALEHVAVAKVTLTPMASFLWINRQTETKEWQINQWVMSLWLSFIYRLWSTSPAVCHSIHRYLVILQCHVIHNISVIFMYFASFVLRKPILTPMSKRRKMILLCCGTNNGRWLTHILFTYKANLQCFNAHQLDYVSVCVWVRILSENHARACINIPEILVFRVSQSDSYQCKIC